jgi:biopolymer transport protein ExbD
MAFGRLPSRPSDPPMSDINVTPMVDVMLVLLVMIFIDDS